MSRFR